METYRWSRQSREYLADDLTGRDCPECGSTLHYKDNAPPWFNPVSSRAYAPAVIWGRNWCTNFGGCEMAPG